MQKKYIEPSLRIHYATPSDIILTSNPDIGFDDGSTDKQDAPRRDTEWFSFNQ